MEIKEIEFEKKITISKIEYSCDIIDPSIPKPLFQNYSSFIILSAPPRSGKSTWIANCLCKKGRVYNKKYDRIYIVSPSLKSAKNDPFACIPPDQIESELTLNFLYRFESLVFSLGTGVKSSQMESRIVIPLFFCTKNFFSRIVIMLELLQKSRARRQ